MCRLLFRAAIVALCALYLFSPPAPVPEPTTLMLVGGGLAGWLVRRHRRSSGDVRSRVTAATIALSIAGAMPGYARADTIVIRQGGIALSETRCSR
jgi:hypothetical protein